MNEAQVLSRARSRAGRKLQLRKSVLNDYTSEEEKSDRSDTHLRKFYLVVRLIAIEYNKRLLCYLFSYIHLLISDLWLDLDLWSRDDILLSSRLLFTRCLLINHALLSDHLPGSVRIQLVGSFKVMSRPSTLALLPQDIAM